MADNKERRYTRSGEKIFDNGVRLHPFDNSDGVDEFLRLANAASDYEAALEMAEKLLYYLANSEARISAGRRWLIVERSLGVFTFVVYERKSGTRKTRTLIKTERIAEAIEEMNKED